MKAIYKGRVIADSDATVVVEDNHYFPRASVDAGALEPSTHHTACPWKGVASYYHVIVDGERNANAAWYYPDPEPAAEQVRDRIAFWHGVRVEA